MKTEIHFTSNCECHRILRDEIERFERNPPDTELFDGYLLALLDIREAIQYELRDRAVRAERNAKATKRPANQRLSLNWQ
jgi:hypothetical protein